MTESGSIIVFENLFVFHTSAPALSVAALALNGLLLVAVGWWALRRGAGARRAVLLALAVTCSVAVTAMALTNSAGDPVLKLQNISDKERRAYCFYADSSQPTCMLTEFNLTLPPQSALEWLVSAGINGVVPPVPMLPFHGELVCVEVDASGFPTPDNALKGTAESGVIDIVAFDTNNMDSALCLGGEVTSSCPTGAEYEGCPAEVTCTRIATCWNQSRFSFLCGSPLTCGS